MLSTSYGTRSIRLSLRHFVPAASASCSVRGMAMATALFSSGGDQPAQRRTVMRMITRTFRWFAAVTIASMVGSLPSCGTMGGGMGHLVAPAENAAESAWM